MTIWICGVLLVAIAGLARASRRSSDGVPETIDLTPMVRRRK